MGRKFGRMAVELGQSRRTAVNRGALAIVGPVRDEIRRATGGDMRLSGVGKSGARVGVRFNQTVDTEAVIRATGPLQLIERDTKAHQIAPKTRGRGAKRAQRKGAVQLADGSYRRSVRHPGTKGQHPFETGVARGRAKAVRELRDVTTSAVRKGMRA